MDSGSPINRRNLTTLDWSSGRWSSAGIHLLSFYETVGSVPHKLKVGPACGFKFKSFRIFLCNTNNATARRLKTRMNGWRGGMRGSSSSLPIQLLCLPIPTSTVPLFPPPLFNTVFQFPPHPLIYSAHVVRSCSAQRGWNSPASPLTPRAPTSPPHQSTAH